MALLDVSNHGMKRTSAAGVTKPGDHPVKMAAPHVTPKGADHMRADKPGGSPSAKADEIGTAFERLQAVVADFQMQQHAQLLVGNIELG